MVKIGTVITMELWLVSIYFVHMTVCSFLVLSTWTSKLSLLVDSSFFVHDLGSYGLANYQFE
jgi:hypothetical protein